MTWFRISKNQLLLVMTCMCALPVALHAGQGETMLRPGYPSLALSAGAMRAELYLPDSEKGYYRATRFDWSGLVAGVRWNGHSFFCDFNTDHDPLNHDDISGTAEEFGIDGPQGFQETPVGESFIKIGIGSLQRPSAEPYNFSKRYRITKTPPWEISRKPGAVVFRQQFDAGEGWAYAYTKNVQVSTDPPVLAISRKLKNTGTKSIQTLHYGHNFLKIDDDPAGPDYAIEFPFRPTFGENSRAAECVALQGNSLVFLKQVPEGRSVWVRINGHSGAEDSSFKIVNRRSGASMTVRTDKPLARLVFYSSRGVLAPEPFVEVKLAPGQEMDWTTTYEFR